MDERIALTGAEFALTYAVFLAVMTWLWNSVRREDRRDHREFLSAAGRYVAGMALAVPVIVASAFLPAGPRLAVWAACVAWILGLTLVGRLSVVADHGLQPTESMVERFVLFTIIVLGELILGVVSGLSVQGRDVKITVTGMIALVIGFGLWWIYFDLVGRRMPRHDGRSLVTWMMSHLPITLAPGPPAGRHPLGAVDLRRQPLPTGRLLGRGVIGAARTTGARSCRSGPSR